MMKMHTWEGKMCLNRGMGHGARARWQTKNNDLESRVVTCSEGLEA